MVSQSDSSILTYDEFILSVLANHPVAKQADLLIENADAYKLSTKGLLDPDFSAQWNQKNFDDKLYYRQYDADVTIPTPLGIRFNAGYENTTGLFLNAERTTDHFGLWNIGVEVDILQGLYINERRMTLKQANVFRALSESQKQNILNELIYSASLSYVDWQKYVEYEHVINENLELSRAYFENTRASFLNGEKTAIDTLEAHINYVEAQKVVSENQVKLVKSRQIMENFLWLEDLPMILKQGVKPQPLSFGKIEINVVSDVYTIRTSHPIIQEKLFKQESLQLTQRLYREKLKPKLKLKYNPLLSTAEDNVAPNFSLSDFKWGFNFSFPLLLRSERGNLQQASIKLRDIGFEIDNKQNELTNNIEALMIQQGLLNEQLVLQQQNISGYQQLLNGENLKLEFGESSLFLLNKRQEKYIESQLKYISLQVKSRALELNYLYYINKLIPDEI